MLNKPYLEQILELFGNIFPGFKAILEGAYPFDKRAVNAFVGLGK